MSAESSNAGRTDLVRRVEKLEAKVSPPNQLPDWQQESLRLQRRVATLEAEMKLVRKQLAAFHAYFDLTELMEIVGKAATVEAVSGMIKRARQDGCLDSDANSGV